MWALPRRHVCSSHALTLSMAMSTLVLFLAVITACSGQLIGNGTVRFYRNGTTSGTNFNSGIVQIYLQGKWGNICRDKFFGQNAADTICYQMGYDGAASYGSSYETTGFGVDTLDPVMSEVDCSNTNYQVITQCSYLAVNESTGCANIGDVYVNCNTKNIWSSPFSGMVRLRGGRYSSEGLVEIYCNGQWGTVCDDGIDDDETDTICAQLGYSKAFAWDNINFIGNTSQPIWFDNLFCGHTDKTCVGYCQSCPSTQGQRCQHIEDLTVQCTYDKTSSSTGSSKNTCINISNSGLSIGVIVTIVVIALIGFIICSIILVGVPLCIYCRKTKKTYVVFN